MEHGFLIDDKGRSWPDNSWELAKRIGYQDPRRDIAAYAVEECGFIHLRPQEGAVRVAICEGRFGLTSFTGAMLVLGRMKPARILLRVLAGGTPAFHVFMDLHDFCTYVEPLAAGAPLEIRLPHLSEVRNPRVLYLPTFAHARPIVDLWEQSHGALTDEVHNAVVASGLFDRTILVRQPPGSSRLVTQHFGSGIRVMRPCEALLAVGRDLDDQPDRDYGAWMAEAYAETLWSRRLRVESCRALVRTSAATLLRTRYDRVLMPWRSASELFVMCLSIQREVPVAVS